LWPVEEMFDTDKRTLVLVQMMFNASSLSQVSNCENLFHCYKTKCICRPM